MTDFARLFRLIFCFAILVSASASAIAQAAETRYRLSEGDQIQITVFNQPDLGSVQSVSSDGAVTLPLVKEVVVEGLTAPEAETAIAKAFVEQEFLRSPQVTVLVTSTSSLAITVLGEVARRGTVRLPEGRRRLSILEAIALAGGFGDVAKKNEVRVERAREEDDTSEVFTIDVGALLNRRSGTASNPVFMVEAGDVIFVPRRIF